MELQKNDKKGIAPASQSNLWRTNLKAYKSTEIAESYFYGAKIKDLSDDKIKEALRMVIVLIGLKTMPEPIETAVLIQHLRFYYGGFSPSDIVFAFELAIEGVTGADLEHYDKISVKYFSKILTKYKTYRNKIVQDAKALMLEPMDADEEKISIISGNYFCSIVLAFWKDYFDAGAFQISGQDIESVYASLDERGFIDGTKKKEFYNSNLEVYKSRLSEVQIGKIVYDAVKNQGNKFNTIQQKIILMAKKDLILDTFLRWKNEEKPKRDEKKA